ncbi:MAG: hypothetical protein ACFE0R_06795 [Salinarimonas sp.]
MIPDENDIVFSMDRDAIIGAPSHHQVSNLGVVQFRNDYDPELLRTISRKAAALKASLAEKRHLNLNFIRGAHRAIPEIRDLVHWPGRLERLEALARTRLEVYPLSVISTIVTFASVRPEDGTIDWHADGIPVTELIPLEIEDLDGGELELYRGHADEGLARVARGETVPEERIVRVRHELGCSVLGQLMRLMHGVRRIRRGRRVTLNLNLRSAERPYIDDNTMCYLGADNPDFAWQEEYIRDLRERVLPAYLSHAP